VERWIRNEKRPTKPESGLPLLPRLSAPGQKGANFGGLKETTLNRLVSGEAVKNSIVASIASVGGRGDEPRIAKESPDFRQQSA